MKREVVGGIVLCLLFVASWSASLVAVSVTVNGVPLSLTHPILEEDGSVLVPIEVFGRTIGIEAEAEVDRLVLRWSGRRRGLEADRYAVRDGTPYVGIEWIVGLVGGEIHRVGDAWFVETATATLEDLEATADRVVLRFDAFVPITIDASDDGTELRLTAHHSGSDIGPQLIVLGDAGIESVRISYAASGRVDVTIGLHEGTIVRTETVEAPGFYSISMETADLPAEASVVRIGDGIDLHELTAILSTAPVRADWLYVEAWRDRYRLAPAVPSTGFGTLASIEDLAASTNAVAAVNLGCSRARPPVDLLIIDGTPYAAAAGEHVGLALDMFGWWAYCAGEATLFAKHGGRGIPIDDLNRPLLYGEVIAYPPGYGGTIARGVPGSFTVVKVRSDRVVSVYEGPFVAADSSATLIVASGEAKARLSLVMLGDTLSLECGIGAAATCFTHAFSAGPILIDSGVAAEVQGGVTPGTATDWIVLATDGHGGLILLSFERETGTEAEALDDLTALLGAMPVPIRDAIVLGRCGSSAFAVRDAASIHRWGSGDPYAAALCLVPLAP